MDSLTHAVRARRLGGGDGAGGWWGRDCGEGPLTSAVLPLHQGQRPCDLADEEVLSLLEELARKQEDVSLGHPLSLQLAE